jgi:hypothetical protein
LAHRRPERPNNRVHVGDVSEAGHPDISDNRPGHYKTELPTWRVNRDKSAIQLDHSRVYDGVGECYAQLGSRSAPGD